ncbi:MAG: fibronectin type III domain-containing protein [Ruminococcus sp.]|nr:fibronectin type III domain-containing protein [Ruminococcus sp.]
MKLKRAAVSALTALLMTVQTAVPAFARETAAVVNDTTSAADTASGEAAQTKSAPKAEAEAVPQELREAQAEEERFVENSPELKELAEYVPEGDTLPCSENDPSYHKYVKRLMDGFSEGEELAAPLTSMALRLRLPLSLLYGADKLVHQDRFADCPKSYGIDVCYFQGNIDWNKVKAQGVSFCILRAGYRGYGSAGTLVLDDRFLEYLKGAKAAGLEVGVYFYTQAITVAEAREEADFVYKYIKGYDLELPVYFDMETVENAVGRLDSAGLTVKQKTDIVEAFCDRIAEHGYRPGVYSNPQWMTYYLDAKRLQAKYPLWLANYTTNTKFSGNFDIWQYAAGPVTGVSSPLADLNVRYHLDTKPDTPTGFSTTAEVSDKTTLCWNKVAGAEGYEVFRRGYGGDVTSLAALTGLKYSVTLTAANYYYYVMSYITVNGEKIYSDPTPELALSKFVPTSFSCSVHGTTSLTLKWTGVEEAISYDIGMKGPDETNYSTVGSTAGTTFTVTGLSPATVYAFKIRAVTKAVNGISYQRFSPETLFGTQDSKITGLKFVTKTANSISIKWNASANGIKDYEVLRYDADRNKYVSAGMTNQTEFTVTGLAQGTAQKLRVRSYYSTPNGLVYGVESAVLSCATKCAAPTGVSVSSADSSYTVSWKAPSGANGYMLYAAPYGSTPVKLGETSELKYTVSGLAKGMYSLYVRPYIKCGSTRYYGVSSATLTAVCGKTAPTVKISSPAQTSLTATWAAVPYASGYEAYMLDRSTGAYTRKASLSASTLKYVFSGLSAGTAYSFKIKALFPDGGSKLSSAVSGTTAAAPKTVGAPANVKATTATATTVTVVWDKVTNAKSYRVYLYNESTSSYKLKALLTDRKFTFTGLTSGRMYKIKIYAVGTDGSLKPSAVYNITPKPVAPKLGLASKTETSATLKWDAAALCSKYYIYLLDPLENTYKKIATTTSTSYTVKNLKVGTRNIFKIKAVAVTNAANFNSLYSAQLSVLTKGIKYYSPCSASCKTLYQAFDELGLPKNYAFQEKIAVANAIKGYEGTAEQNTAMLETLKKGKLIVPQF